MQSLWKTVWTFLKTLKIVLLYDPAIPLLGIHPDKTIIQKDTCTPMFIEALFTIAKIWKQSTCPSTDGILLSHKKEWNNGIHSNMDGPRDYHTKQSQKEKNKHHMISWIYLQNRNRLTDIENKLVVAKGEGGGGREGLGVWV